MENRIKHILLVRKDSSWIAEMIGKSALLLSLLLSGTVMHVNCVVADDSVDKPAAVQVITPEVEPREVSEADIDDEIFGIGFYAGVLSIDNFGTEPVYGVRALFHATEDLFLQFDYGVSRADKTTFEELSGDNVSLLSSSDRDYTYYNVLLGYNIFPGEVFMTSKLTFNSAFYLVGGVGNTRFGGEDNFTTTLGTGYRIVLRDWLTWNIDFRDHIFRSDIIKSNQTTHNIELSTGIAFFY
jgi:outer membrane beta-barrel protein